MPGTVSRYSIGRRERVVHVARLLALLFALALSTTSTALVVVIHVPVDYQTISEALAAAPDGAVIEIAAGTYRRVASSSSGPSACARTTAVKCC